MNEKKGQITVFIIIGLLILFVIGIALYQTRTTVTKEFEAARPKVIEVPLKIKPLKDLVETCITRLATDGLKKIGDSGGYVDSSLLSYNAFSPTEGEAVQFSPEAGPLTAYWYHMKSDNDCRDECIFASSRPPLRKKDGDGSIEQQLDDYIADNLATCLDNFEQFKQQGCTVQELSGPIVKTTVADKDVFFTGDYGLRATCGDQSFEIRDFYVTIDLNLAEIYTLATEVTNLQIENRFIDEATKNLLYVFSELDPDKLPPPREFEYGPPMAGTYWIKYEVMKKFKNMLVTYVPLIQLGGVRNYNYILAENVRNDELAEALYNRQFLIPLNNTYPNLEARFAYFDWWEPYFQLNCRGQLCGPESVTGFDLLPFTLNRYTFAYDTSFPILLEIRNPKVFNGEGYSFKIFLEQNMRNSDTYLSETELLEIPSTKAPSIFCDPPQRTSGEVSVEVKDAETMKGMDASINYVCGKANCNIGTTINGTLVSKFPRCIGGILRAAKPNYAMHSEPIDTQREDTLSVSITLEPVRIISATIKNFAVTKLGKFGQWDYKGGPPLRPGENQSATIQMTRHGTVYEAPFVTAALIEGDNPAEMPLIPGNYTISINSFLKQNITIPSDNRCTRIKGGLFSGDKEECFLVPANPIIFNQTNPFPYGLSSFEYVITSEMLRGASNIEFRQFVIAIDRVAEQNRIVEDINQLENIQEYSEAYPDKVRPVIT